MPTTHRLERGKRIRLSEINTDGKEVHPNRSAAESEFEALRLRLIEFQNRWYADGRRSLLIVFQAMDAGGKDGTIRRVFAGVNPQGVRVASFKAPTAPELAHDFLWRIHQQVPAAGMIGVFNRSHYEDVLIVRVDELVTEAVWRARYRQINEFERLLTDCGTTILKFYLHISKKEQKKRLVSRLEDPAKHWKFAAHDLDKRRQWDKYQAAYEDALFECNTDHAPWHVIPADQKWYRNLAIARVIVDTLQGLDPQFPEPEPGLEQIQVE